MLKRSPFHDCSYHGVYHFSQMFQVFSLIILAHLLYFYVKSVLNLNMHRGVWKLRHITLFEGMLSVSQNLALMQKMWVMFGVSSKITPHFWMFFYESMTTPRKFWNNIVKFSHNVVLLLLRCHGIWNSKLKNPLFPSKQLEDLKT